jgi:leucyl-tRNA synthetase
MPPNYHPREIEKKWQEKWDTDRLYEVNEDSSRPKYYALTMFPYTSGDLHIGHWYAMAPADVHARFKRMQGYNVLHPVGFDAFGLPAENAAIRHGIHPHEWTMKNVENMRRQLKSIGAVYDWKREVITCLPEYYRWTQWLFLRLYHAGLVYRDKAPVNWCPECKTVLANEQVKGGLCERCGSTVTRKDLEQWFFRITRYADELLDFSKADWPEKIEVMQRNWIGRSEGAEISFELEREYAGQKEIRIFTTRPDTIFGVTFFVLAPEHPLVPYLTAGDRKAEVKEYIEGCRRQTDYERTSMEKEKTGVFLGSYVINKLSGARVPVWIADYVLPTYGGGAVMGVPGHDERDFEFASKFALPVQVVIAPPDWAGGNIEQAYTEPGIMVNSGSFSGLFSEQGAEAISEFLKKKGWGKRTVTYRLRDWLVSRQRYWGAPIPMVYCDKCGIVPVPEEDLPVLLPCEAEFKPTGESPLKYCSSFVNTVCPYCGGAAERETDTMDTFVCSSWYFLRYTSPGVSDAPFDDDLVKYWLPADIYTGGAEHAVMHLLYARFFIKALRDIGLVEVDEPFIRLVNQGTIIHRGNKMSKSRGNVVAPDEYVATLGADAVRVYIMFIGPWEMGGEWSDNGIVGMSRWLKRIWGLAEEKYTAFAVCDEEERKLRRTAHKTIKKATEDMERLHFNTMLASLMEFTNYLSKVRDEGTVAVSLWRENIVILLLLLAPVAPHLAEELWGKMGQPYSIHTQRWPEWDEKWVQKEEFTLVVQVNGKLRDRMQVSVSVTGAEARQMALGRQRVKDYLGEKEVAKVIYLPGRLVNVVTR